MKWVVFHGSSDFAYLLRLVVGEELPQTIDDFYKTMKTYFPNIYDLKYIIKDIPGLKDVGLAKLSYEIGVLSISFSAIVSAHSIRPARTVCSPSPATSKCSKRVNSLDQSNSPPA
jgi:CCR4-NOT transcription complex subunit 7/8